MSVGVVIGRFQVAELTAGHIELLDTVAENHELLLILVGEAPTQPNPRNPLPFYIRAAMLREYSPDALIVPIVDCMEHTVWSKRVDATIRGAIGQQSATLYGSRDSFIPYYTGAFPTIQLETTLEESGTEQRAAWKETALVGAEFRAGMIHAVTNQFPSVFPTVDMAVVRGNHVLLGRKADEQLWRLPGGHVDPADGSFAIAAERELKEECGVVAPLLTYVASRRVEDWRTRGTGNTVMTTVFLADIGDQEPEAGDDLVELRWFPVMVGLQAITETLVPDHRELLILVQNHLLGMRN